MNLTIVLGVKYCPNSPLKNDPRKVSNALPLLSKSVLVKFIGAR